MKKLGIFATLIICVMLCAMLASCNAASDSEPRLYNKEASGNESLPKEIDYSSLSAGDNLIDKSDDAGTFERQIIKTVRISAETKKYDEAIKSLDGIIETAEGYVESSDFSGKSLKNNSEYYHRTASYTIRVPAAKLDAFLGELGDTFNIVSSKGNIDDVTAEYYDIVSRLETLEAEKKALTEMYEKAEDIGYMLQVQERLYNVIEEIEANTTKLNYYKSQVAYSTVYLNIEEVIEYTEFSEEPTTYGERIAVAFKESWQDFANGCRNFSVWIVYAFPTLLVLGVIGGGIAFMVVAIVRHAKKKKINKE